MDIIIFGEYFSADSIIQLYQIGNNNNPQCKSIQYVSINQLVCKNLLNLQNGELNATITSFSGISNNAQIATIDDCPIIDTQDYPSISIQSTIISINVINFDESTELNQITLFQINNSTLITYNIPIQFIENSSNSSNVIINFSNVLSTFGFITGNISIIISKYNGSRFSSFDPIIIAKIIPFISEVPLMQNNTHTNKNYYLPITTTSIIINGFGFVSQNNNIIINIYQPTSSIQPNCTSIQLVSSNSIICQNIMFYEIGDVFATIIIDNQFSFNNQTLIAKIMPITQLIDDVNNSKLLVNSIYLTISGQNFDNFTQPTTTSIVYLSYLNLQTTCKILQITQNQIICTNFTLNVAQLQVTVSSFGVNSSSIYFNIYDIPTISTQSQLNLFTNATEIRITIGKTFSEINPSKYSVDLHIDSPINRKKFVQSINLTCSN